MSSFFIVMGVSGGGKTTVLRESGVLSDPRFTYVPSYTTRPLRPHEKNGEKYYHVSEEEFTQAVEKGEFLEYAYVHDTNWYGTKYRPIKQALANESSPIKEMDMHGLIQLQKRDDIDLPTVSIFLSIPNDIIVKRINKRGVLPANELQERIESAEFERAAAQERCDYIIDANQPLDNVVETFIHTIDSELS